MKTEEAKNEFIERHNNAVEICEPYFVKTNLSQNKLTEFLMNVVWGRRYLLEMGYSNIHSLRSIVDAYSWETEINNHGLTKTELPYLEEVIFAVRAFVIYTFKERFNMIFENKNGVIAAILPFTNFKISTITKKDYRVLYAEMLQKESVKWKRRISSLSDENIDINTINTKEKTLFKIMRVNQLDHLSCTLGAIDDFILTVDFNEYNFYLYNEVLCLALCGLIVNNEGANWLCDADSEEDEICIDAVFIDDYVNVDVAIISQISFKESNEIFNIYIEGLEFSRQIFIAGNVSMQSFSTQFKLAINQLWEIKN